MNIGIHIRVKEMKKKDHRFFKAAVPVFAALLGLVSLYIALGSGSDSTVSTAAGIFGSLLLTLCLFIFLGFGLRK